MIMQTAQRVSESNAAQQQSDARALERIRRRTEASVAYHTRNPEQIPRRLDELDAEWDLERALAAGTSGLTLASLLFTVLRGGKWLLLGLGVQAFALQHALGRRCAPVDLLRSVGLRTRHEIDEERRELEALLDDAGGPDEQRGGDAEGGASQPSSDHQPAGSSGRSGETT